MMAIPAARSTRPWRAVIRVVAAFAVMSAVGVLAWSLILMVISASYWWDYLTAVDVAKIVGMSAGMLTLWFSIAALLSGVLARGARPRAFLAGVLGLVAASVLGLSFVSGQPILGVFIAPLVAGLLVGRASWAASTQSW